MPRKPLLIAMDLEGVLIPEIWIAVAEHTGIEKLRLTTRDVADYDELMRGRLQLLRDNDLTLDDIEKVIRSLHPLPGAHAFLEQLRRDYQVIILSDTYYEFAGPLMEQLGRPTLFCNYMEIDSNGTVVDYHLRKKNGKKHAVAAFRDLNFCVLATGDSYNDTTMLAEAHCGILFKPSRNVRDEFPQYQVADSFEDMLALIREFDETRNE